MRKRVKKQLLFLFCFYLVSLLPVVNAVGSVTYTDPAGDVYQGISIGYLGADWNLVSDPAVDMVSIQVGNGMTTGECTIGVVGGLSSLAAGEYVVFCVSVNVTADTYQMVMFLHQGGAWSCVMLAVYDGVVTMDTPAVVITDVTVSAVGHDTFLDYENGTVTAYAVRYVSLASPIEYHVDFYPDAHFAGLAPADVGGDTFLGVDWAWWVLIAVIAIVIVIIIILATRGSKPARGHRKTSRKNISRKK
jgi:hypothetical protein